MEKGPSIRNTLNGRLFLRYILKCFKLDPKLKILSTETQNTVTLLVKKGR
jgi:hypothetical protein